MKKAIQVYKDNKRIESAMKHANGIEVIPAVKHVSYSQSYLKLKNVIHIVAHPDFHTEVAIMKDKLASLYAIVEDSLSEVQLTLDYLQQKENAVNEEYYELNVTNDKIHISAITPHGIFNGIQTFLSLLKGQEAPYSIKSVFIKDYPDFPIEDICKMWHVTS